VRVKAKLLRSVSWQRTNSLRQNSSIHSRIPITETFRLLWIRNLHYCVHKSPSLVLILNQTNPVYVLPMYIRSILILSYLRPNLPSGFHPSRFPIAISYAFLITLMRDSPVCLASIYIITLIICGGELKL